VLQAQHIGEERAHFPGAKNKNFHTIRITRIVTDYTNKGTKIGIY
jgi:hypothetical protein